MKVRTHFHLAKLSLKENSIKFPKSFSHTMFYLGTIIADCCWLPYTNPHFHSKSFNYVEKKLDYLFETRKCNAYTSLQLGIIIHYLCDFCCYSHISGGIGNVNEHLLYERKIQKYLLNNLSNLHNKIKGNNPIKSINNLKDIIKINLSKYKKGAPSFSWDIDNSIQISSLVCLSFFEPLILNV